MSTPEEFEALARQVASQAQVIRTKTGRYLWWAGRAGEELWLQVDRRDQFVGMHPHFTGKSSVRVGLEARVRREQHPTLVGAFRGWASPQDDQPSSGTYPFIFDLPDAARYEGLPLPCIVQAQLAAFAHEMTVYDSLEADQVGLETPGL